MNQPTLARATLIGGRGFIGRHLAADLRRRGLEVQTPYRLEAWEESDTDLLIWAAGCTPDDEREPGTTIAAHAADLARALATKRYRVLIYLSSARLYERRPGRVSEATPLGLDPADPGQLYDLSKGLGEWLVRHHAAPRAHVLRLADVYADDLDGGSLLEDLIARALEGWSGAVDAAPDAARDYAHVEDVCRAIWAVAESGTRPLYLVGSGETIDNQTLFGLLSERTGVRIEPQRAPEGVIDPTLDVSALEADLGLRPRALSEGLDRVLTFQDNQRAMRSMMGVTAMPWM